MTNNVVESRTQRMWLGEDGILYALVIPGSETTGEDALEIIEIEKKLIQGKKRPVFVDNRGVKSITREGREHLSGEEYSKISLAVAALVESPVSKVIMNIYMSLNKPIFPTRVFTSQDEAIAWLQEFISPEKDQHTRGN